MHRMKADILSFHLISCLSKLDGRQWRIFEFEIAISPVQAPDAPVAKCTCTKQRKKNVREEQSCFPRLSAVCFWQMRCRGILLWSSLAFFYQCSAHVHCATGAFSACTGDIAISNSKFLHCLPSNFDKQSIKWKLKTSAFIPCIIR